jgi:hypothetical protein
MSSRSTKTHYSNKSEEAQAYLNKNDDDLDFLAEFTEADICELERQGLAREHDTGPMPPDEIAEMMAALGPSDPSTDGVAPTPARQPDEWLADFKALARKHRPFSMVQMVEILRALNAVDDPAVDAGMGR